MKSRLMLTLVLAAWIAAFPALAEKKYDPGVTDTEIKIGQTTIPTAVRHRPTAPSGARRPPTSR